MKLGLLLILGLAACDGVFTLPNADHHSPSPDAHVVTGQLVFTTSEKYRGGLLGGLEGADQICAKHAAAAGLPGTFKAWLSQVGTSAADRLTHSTLPYVLVDGTAIASSWDGLLQHDLLHAIDKDEHGTSLASVDPADVAVWTFTRIDGTANPWEPGGTMTSNPRLDCTLWSSLGSWGLVGIWTETGTAWTASSRGDSCSETARLYCFRQ